MTDRYRLFLSLLANVAIAPQAMMFAAWDTGPAGANSAELVAYLAFFWPALVLSGCVQYWSNARHEDRIRRFTAGVFALPAAIALILILNPGLMLLIQDFNRLVSAGLLSGAGTNWLIGEMSDLAARSAAKTAIAKA